MKKLLVFINCCVALQLFAQDKITPAVKSFEALSGKTIELNDNGANGVYANIIEKKGMVLFRYTFTASQNESVTDDEYTETLAFTYTPDKTGRFTLKGEALKKAKAYFYKGCFCMDRGYMPILDGVITGTKMSKTTWYVKMNVSYKSKQGDSEQIVTKKLTGTFTLTNK